MSGRPSGLSSWPSAFAGKGEGAVFQFGKTQIAATLSLGCATLSGNNHQTPEALLEAADENLYRAKRSGRNRVEPAPG